MSSYLREECYKENYLVKVKKYYCVVLSNFMGKICK